MSGDADAVGPLLRTPESLGAALRTLRSAAGLSQAELAEWSGVSRQYVVQLEGGDVSQQVRRLLDLFAVLGADLVVVPRGVRGGG
jgi:HTH-type transcriptional regulator/antitoxin HipB